MRRKDFSLAGAVLIVISQVLSTFHASENVSGEIQKFRDEFQQSIVDRETFFVRKTDVAQISNRIDNLSSKIVILNEQIKRLKSEYSSYSKQSEIIGCSYKKGGSINASPF